MIASVSSATVRFSTADLPHQHRVAMWREHFARMVLRVDIEPVGDNAFEASLAARAFPGLHLLFGTMSIAHIARTRTLLADSNDDLALIINRRGTIAASARGRDLVLLEGDGVLMNFGEITTFDRYSPGGSFSLRIPRSVLSSLAVDVDDNVMRLIPRHTEALRLLSGYTSLLIDDNVLITPELRRLTVTHALDLVVLILGARRDAGIIARSRGVRAARLRAAKAHVIENSYSRNLSVGVVAANLGVTQRYVQKLFESEGTTFSAFVLSQRLKCAHRMLNEQQFAQSAVSTIAYDAGFGDISYFNRCFRQHYGVTPRDIRESAATPPN